jgi:hypothetical protein
MNTRNPTPTRTRLDASLRTLDAAETLSAEQRQRAAVTLERIMANAPAAGAAPVRRSRRRLLLLPAAAAALALVAVAVPLASTPQRAYASWTAVPTALTPAETTLVAPACRKELRGGSLDLGRANLVLAERRGEYVVLLYRTDNPDVSGSCLAHNPPGTDDVDDVRAAIGGSSGPALAAPPRSFTEGALADFRDASVTDGAVGADVTGVTIRTGERTVQASVRNGRYVAWWPGPSTNHNGQETLRYDLTLTDGTVVRDAPPTRPN